MTERPLTGSERVALVCGAQFTIFLFYLFALGSILLLLCALVIEVLLLLVLLRFGLAGLITPHLELDLSLVKILFRCFRIGKRTIT